MTAPNSDKEPNGFGERLAKARKRIAKEDQEQVRRGNAMGIAFRIGVELAVGLFIGSAIGWLLDQWLGTSPWLMIIFFFLGAAAGIRNVFITALRMQEEANDNEE
ncbi:MAG: AtpZ/AtpI family protein [Alphaproteobacteria bacterium]|nr:AtpZ/AtpI family protein [Alphaproteobacteria bacterium]